jgi:transcriptional regulator with XRE-family HTH domain
MSGRSSKVDHYVGGRVRLRRMELGMTQEMLGERLGVTFQQVQKYENGTNRISAGRLYTVARKLEVPITYFFEGIPEDMEEKAADEKLNPILTLMGEKDTLRMARAFSQIDRSDIRKHMVNLLESLASRD